MANRSIRPDAKAALSHLTHAAWAWVLDNHSEALFRVAVIATNPHRWYTIVFRGPSAIGDWGHDWIL